MEGIITKLEPLTVYAKNTYVTTVDIIDFIPELGDIVTIEVVVSSIWKMDLLRRSFDSIIRSMIENATNAPKIKIMPLSEYIIKLYNFETLPNVDLFGSCYIQGELCLIYVPSE